MAGQYFMLFIILRMFCIAFIVGFLQMLGGIGQTFFIWFILIVYLRYLI